MSLFVPFSSLFPLTRAFVHLLFFLPVLFRIQKRFQLVLLSFTRRIDNFSRTKKPINIPRNVILLLHIYYYDYNYIAPAVPTRLIQLEREGELCNVDSVDIKL